MRTKTDAPEVKAIALRAFPSYRGRKFFLDIVPDDRKLNLASYWDGGSRDYYTFVSLIDRRTFGVGQNGTCFDTGNPHQATLPPGVVCVCRAVFLGKESGLTVTVRQSDTTPMLTA